MLLFLVTRQISLAELPFAPFTVPSAAASVLFLEVVSMSTRGVFSNLSGRKKNFLGQGLAGGLGRLLMDTEMPLKTLVFISLTGVGGA